MKKRQGYWRSEGVWKVFIGFGWILFCPAATTGESLNVVYLLVAPAPMFIGLAMVMRAKSAKRP